MESPPSLAANNIYIHEYYCTLRIIIIQHRAKYHENNNVANYTFLQYPLSFQHKFILSREICKLNDKFVKLH